MYGIPIYLFSNEAPNQGITAIRLFDEALQVWDLLLGEKEAGRLGDLRVVNFSIRHVAADSFMRGPMQIEHANRAFRDVAERAARNGVMIVQAAGNEALPAVNQASFAWAVANWTSSLPNPVIVVEAIGNTGVLPQSVARASFSNTGGDITAPGVQIAGPELNGTYHRADGTSLSAPFVTALAGYLLAYDPTLDIPKLRSALLSVARDDTGTGVPPRLDAFASLMSLPGALRDLVDVNQEAPVPLAPNKDGNRRVFLGASVPGSGGGGVEAGDDVSFARTPGTFADPDGRIDMRDFRRFRDAWLEVCRLLPSSDPGCPAPENIVLNGAADHPKKDLNHDACVNTTNQPTNASCPTPEYIFSRFDFNGDGRISSADPAAVPGLGEVTDLEVLRRQWSPGPDYQEGWTANNLDRLLLSGDLELRADDFFAAGADQVEIKVIRKDPAGDEDGPTRILRRDEPGQFIVVTVPVVRVGPSQVEVHASARIGANQVSAIPRVGTLRPGEDKRLDLCRVRLDLTASANPLPADGATQATITATAEDCIGGPLDEQTIRFTMSPAGTGHATLSAPSGQTSADGKATVTFTAGTTPSVYTIIATLDIGNGQQVTASLPMQTTSLLPLQIAYVWEQTNLTWSEGGTTRWTGNPPTMPDCDDAPVSGYIGYCIDSAQVELIPRPPLRREGVLSGVGSNVRLTERVAQSEGASSWTWSLTNPDGSLPRTGDRQAFWSVAASERERYRDYALPSTVTIDNQQGGITLSGLKAVAELAYGNFMNETTTGGSAGLVELPGALADLMILPRGDGSALRYAVDVEQPLFFPRQPDGTFAPYQFCMTVTDNRTSTFGYLLETPDPTAPFGVVHERKTTFAPGDRPLPVGPGSMQRRFAFAAAVGYGASPQAVSLPDCSSNIQPTPSFTFSPTQPDEGGTVTFTDRSTDADNNISQWRWAFGDGTTSSERHPEHLYQDSGIYPVTLTVTDSAGAEVSTTQQVMVRNLPPEVQLGGASAGAGSGLALPYRVWDPAPGDLATLDWVLTSSAPGLSPVSGTGAVQGIFSVDGLPPGEHSFTLTATDKDGASASATATGTVLAGSTRTSASTLRPSLSSTCAPAVACPAAKTLTSEVRLVFATSLDAASSAAQHVRDAWTGLTNVANRFAGTFASAIETLLAPPAAFAAPLIQAITPTLTPIFSPTASAILSPTQTMPVTPISSATSTAITGSSQTATATSAATSA
jgi:PKD repeat protein